MLRKNHFLLPFQTPPSDRNFLNACWGKLASEILMQNWDIALDDLNKVKDLIDNSVRVFHTKSLKVVDF